MIIRTETIFDGETVVETKVFDVNWNQVRNARDSELLNSDWRFMSDQSPSQEWIDYRQFLRDLPQNYDSPNEAADAWAAYVIPE
ncbi:MAG: phage tail assembly chaperone [Euryarchaeota archaeon]